MNPSSITLSRAGAVATVTLARPQARNAFDAATIAALHATFIELGAEARVRVIVLAAEGPAFCAGADLNWMRAMAGYSEAENREDAMQLARMLRAVAECPKPVIARVQGDAFGGGVGLVAACDLAVAAASARFCLSEVKLGLIPATIAPYVLRAMGTRAAQRYTLTAEVFTATTAQQLGLVHEAAADAAQLDAQVQQWCAALQSASPQALAAAKRLLADVAARHLNEALLADTAERIAQARASDDGREGIAAFLQRRKPSWANN
ncbi:MAG: enoyl-CoA hydratase/isomerase family protein [Betaproteobacteria bacterium]|nr:enoyl-CoA hydratase/isomerase family protein [Betaproteobacteria bacterium]MDE2122721.1 enoyl-CoA hydratase/isomerase family protein [Betaproteobacteria bacterium]MDE2185662.1 enoyl-CoA hydratase/isomerase family protein [Betaproteobacteria bacterium]MDE2323880.1 enoyl-CoA hydratase/isomerase family protein [Betaproteobacteria bacterium]